MKPIWPPAAVGTSGLGVGLLRLGGRRVGAVRNNPGKPGVKPRVDAGGRRADEVELRAQWDAAWADYQNWDRRVRRHGKTTKNRFGERQISAEYRGYESARKHLLAVSRALADVLGLASEDEHRRGAVISITKGAGK